ncbi:MAG TPA: TPM domain-containing protein [Candidatus Paceibacterota bacterium]|jgi:Beta-propeller domains of methanol dehydrogenase type
MRYLRFIAIVAFTVSLVSANAVLAYVSPGVATGYVNDFAKILTDEQRATLENKIGNFERPAGVELAVVTVPSLEDETIESYAVKLFEEWKIGKARADNGLLILVAPNDRAARIEVGYGLEPVVTDAAASGIIRNIMIPAFKVGDWYGGVNGATDAVISLVEGSTDASSFAVPAQRPVRDYGSLAFVAIVIGLNLISVMARTKSWWLGGLVGVAVGAFLGGLFGAGIGAVIGLIADFLLSHFGSRWFSGRGPRGPFFWGGMGGGRGGSSGFGGFGGGSSGGGGASGRW